MSQKNKIVTEMPAKGHVYLPAEEYDALALSLDFLPDVLCDNTVAILFGPSGAGKTFVGIHMMGCAATGRNWFSSGTKTEKRRGLYVALEGEASFKARIKAWCKAHGIQKNPFHYRLGRFHLADEDAVVDLIDYMIEHRIEVVVIDTLSLAMAGMDEISGQHMTQVLEVLHRIKRETGACVAVVAHTGKDVARGERGHSSQRGNVDSTIEVVVHNKETVQKGGRLVTVEHQVTLSTLRSIVVRKQRDGEANLSWQFALELQETDLKDARERVVRSPALIEGAATRFSDLNQEAPVPALSENDNVAMAVLDELRATHDLIGLPPTLANYRKALVRAKWRAGDKPATWRKAWERLSGKLVIDSSGGIEGGLTCSTGKA